MKRPGAHKRLLVLFSRRSKKQFKTSKGKTWSSGTNSRLLTPSHEQTSAYAFIQLIGRKQCVETEPEGRGGEGSEVIQTMQINKKYNDPIQPSTGAHVFQKRVSGLISSWPLCCENFGRVFFLNLVDNQEPIKFDGLLSITDSLAWSSNPLLFRIQW